MNETLTRDRVEELRAATIDGGKPASGIIAFRYEDALALCDAFLERERLREGVAEADQALLDCIDYLDLLPEDDDSFDCMAEHDLCGHRFCNEYGCLRMKHKLVNAARATTEGE